MQHLYHCGRMDSLWPRQFKALGLSLLMVASAACADGADAPDKSKTEEDENLSSRSTALESVEPPRLPGDFEVQGLLREGDFVIGSLHRWEGAPEPEVSYQWLRCDEGGKSCEKISGETTRSYTVGFDDVPSRGEVEVSCLAVDSAGAEGERDTVTVRIGTCWELGGCVDGLCATPVTSGAVTCHTDTVAGGVCDDGECIGGGPVDCDDGDPCTVSYCDEEVGCVNERIPDCTIGVGEEDDDRVGGALETNDNDQAFVCSQNGRQRSRTSTRMVSLLLIIAAGALMLRRRG